MKKFFSILCALTIVLSASAKPAKVLGKSKQAEAVEVKTVKAHQTLPATSFQKAERAAVALRAQQAKKENYNVTITLYSDGEVLNGDATSTPWTDGGDLEAGDDN
jgi:hypothetical protein